jgi:AcrR family transcriptional regulator
MLPGRQQTSDRVLHIAAAPVRTQGFNAFSYADIARTVGIRKASLHPHFATKAALGVALVARYRSAFLDTPLQRYSRRPPSGWPQAARPR